MVKSATLMSEFFISLTEQPSELVTVSVTEYIPLAVYVCDGDCWVDVLPSPKFHSQERVPVPVDVFWKRTVAGALQKYTSLAVNEGLMFPFALMSAGFTMLLAQPYSDTAVRLTLAIEAF